MAGQNLSSASTLVRHSLCFLIASLSCSACYSSQELFLLSRRDRLIFGAILLPVILVIFYLATRTPPSYYPIAKITLSILPFLIGLVFVALSRVAANNQDRPIAVLKKLLCALDRCRCSRRVRPVLFRSAQ